MLIAMQKQINALSTQERLKESQRQCELLTAEPFEYICTVNVNAYSRQAYGYSMPLWKYYTADFDRLFDRYYVFKFITVATKS